MGSELLKKWNLHLVSKMEFTLRIEFCQFLIHHHSITLLTGLKLISFAYIMEDIETQGSINLTLNFS